MLFLELGAGSGPTSEAVGGKTIRRSARQRSRLVSSSSRWRGWASLILSLWLQADGRGESTSGSVGSGVLPHAMTSRSTASRCPPQELSSRLVFREDLGQCVGVKQQVAPCEGERRRWHASDGSVGLRSLAFRFTSIVVPAWMLSIKRLANVLVQDARKHNLFWDALMCIANTPCDTLPAKAQPPGQRDLYQTDGTPVSLQKN